MLKRVFLLLMLLSLYSPVTLVAQQAPPENKVNIGYLDPFKESTESLVVNDLCYPLYKFLDTLYIPLDYLKDIDVATTLESTDLYLTSPIVREDLTQTSLALAPDVYLEPLTLYMDSIKFHILRNGEHLFIPLSSLFSTYDTSQIGNTLHLNPRPYQDMCYLSLNDTDIVNHSTYSLTVQMLDIIWDGESCIENKRTLTLAPSSSCAKTDFMQEFPSSYQYLTSAVTSINGMSNLLPETLFKDLKNDQVYKAHLENQNKLKKLDSLFQPTYTQATMKYPASTLQYKESVSILWAEKKKYYMVQDTSGKEHWVPWGSLDIEGKSWYAPYSVTDQDIEDYANIHALTSDTDYFVWTDVARHRTYVLKKLENRWCVEKNFVCATGKDKNPTPIGTFKLEYTIPYFGMDHGFRCKYAIVFFRDFMYHSVLFDKEGNYVIKSQLGANASSGCVRLSVDDSKWLYENIPMGTTVWIN